MVGDFEIPIMYQDMANYTMSPMSMPMMPFGNVTGAGQYGNTSYLGGTQIKPQLDSDKIEIMNKKEAEGKSTAKKVALGLGVVFLMGFIPGLFGKKSVFSQLSGFLSKHSKTAKTHLSNFWTKLKGKPNKLARFKAWCSVKWNAFKGIFKRKKSAPQQNPAPAPAPNPTSASNPTQTLNP